MEERRQLTAKEIELAKPGERLYGALGPDLPGALLVKVGSRTHAASAEAGAAKRMSRHKSHTHGAVVRDLYYRYRVQSQDRLIKLGRYEARGAPHGLTLADAHARCREYAEKLKNTPDLKVALELRRRAEIEQRRQELREHREADVKTLQALLDVYVAHLRTQGKNNSARDAATAFRVHVGAAHPELAALPAASITADDVAVIVRRVAESGKDRTAGKLRAYLGAAFRLALTAATNPKAPAAAIGFKLTGNPVAAVAAHSGVTARSRVLDDKELRHLLEKAEKLPEVQRDAVALLLLLGGQRVEQLLRAKVENVKLADVGTCTLTLYDPKGRRREPRPHVLPLSDAAREIVKRRFDTAEKFGCEWLFTTNGRAALRLETLSEVIKGISDSLIAHRSPRELRAKRAKVGFQLRDLRRTAETRLAALGISRDVRAQLLSHGLAGVQALHYDRHGYEREKAAALAAWEMHLQAVRAGRAMPGNVVPLTVK